LDAAFLLGDALGLDFDADRLVVLVFFLEIRFVLAAGFLTVLALDFVEALLLVTFFLVVLALVVLEDALLLGDAFRFAGAFLVDDVLRFVDFLEVDLALDADFLAIRLVFRGAFRLAALASFAVFLASRVRTICYYNSREHI